MKMCFIGGKKNFLGLSSSHYTFFALSILTMFSFPQYSAAQAANVVSGGLIPQDDAPYTMQDESALYSSAPISLPASPNAVRIVSAHDKSGQMWIVITAYSSTPDQTKPYGDPFITATGNHVRDGIIAANFLPFGTKVRFPTLYGDKIFIVDDRMNARYFYRADVWMQTRQDAEDFGIHIAPMEIINS